MNAIALKAATHPPATPSFGADLSAALGRAYAALVLWHRRREQRRDFVRCAAVVGHRFAADTLISSSDLPRNPARPFRVSARM